MSSDDLEVEGQGEAGEPIEGELEPGVGGVVPASSRGAVQGGRRPVQWRDLLRGIDESGQTNCCFIRWLNMCWQRLTSEKTSSNLSKEDLAG